MPNFFEGKVRRFGNSMAVIIPKEILEEMGLYDGDTLKLSVPISKQKRMETIKKMAGISIVSKPFKRDKRDRI
jgi:antitoxin component of MazEF toxin-antitoxin module